MVDEDLQAAQWHKEEGRYGDAMVSNLYTVDWILVLHGMEWLEAAADPFFATNTQKDLN